MELTTRTIAARKHIALVSHDHCKKSLLAWVMENRDLLAQHELYATGTTGNLVQKATGMEYSSSNKPLYCRFLNWLNPV